MTATLLRIGGAMICVISIMALGACISHTPAPINAQGEIPQSQITVPQNSCQRFVIVMNPNMRADQFLLDSQTGKVWHKVAASEYVGEPLLWEPMDRPETDQEESELLSRYVKKSKKK